MSIKSLTTLAFLLTGIAVGCDFNSFSFGLTCTIILLSLQHFNGDYR